MQTQLIMWVQRANTIAHIIPLSSWHRVTTTGNNRMSFRFLGNNDYILSQICDLYDKKELFKG